MNAVQHVGGFFLGLVDMPISLVFDTLLLPVDALRAPPPHSEAEALMRIEAERKIEAERAAQKEAEEARKGKP